MNKGLTKRLFTRSKLIILLITVLSVVLVNLLAYSYLKTEQTVYYWDISAYWKNAIDLLATFEQSTKLGLTAVKESLSSDYNYLPILPLLPFMELFGTSRGIFVLLILNLYVVPFAIITTYALSLLTKFKQSKNKVVFYAALLPAILFFPPVLTPVFDGRVDSIALLLMSFILLLYVKTRFSRYWHYVLLGVLLCLMLLLRRYYSYWALGFFVSFAIVTVVSKWFEHSKKIDRQFWLSLVKPASGALIAGLTIVAILLVGFREIFLRYIGENYAEMYSAYLLGGFFDQFVLFFRNFGLIFIALMVTGITISFIKYRRTLMNGMSLFIIIQSLVIYFAFTYTQTFGVHHYYMLVPLFIWGFALLIKYLLELKNRRLKYILTISFIAIVATLSLISFTGERKLTVNPYFQLVFGLSENIRPVVRSDLDALKELSKYMQSTMEGTDYVYILASSDTFNDDIFRNINLPNPTPVNVSGVAHVDKRDGFPNYFFDAQYVIVASPIQTHIEIDGQSVITVLARAILNGEAKNLKEINSFSIDNGVTLKVYKKDSAYSPSFVKKIRDIFADKYPTYPSLNNITASGQ